MPKAKVGDIKRYKYGHDDRWYIVTHLGPQGGPIGYRILSDPPRGLKRCRLGGKALTTVPPSRVPDRVWVALAKWRLTS